VWLLQEKRSDVLFDSRCEKQQKGWRLHYLSVRSPRQDPGPFLDSEGDRIPGLPAQDDHQKKEVLMPRRPAVIKRDIPLYLIPHLVLQGVRSHGGELERVVVQKTRCHFYTVSIRTRPIKRELKGRQPCYPAPARQKRGEKGEPE